MTTTVKSVFWKGARDGLPFLFVISPFALLFGVVATEAGLEVYEALAYSVVVIAGAAQFTSLALLADHAPALIALLSALTVNLRMAMYSASLTPWIGSAPLWQRALAAYFMVDQSYALAIAAYERRPEWTVPQRVAYFFGVVLPICPFWFIMTVVGAVVGASIPDAFALDFAIPITFLAMVAPMFRTLAHVVAALVAVVVALAMAWLPYNLGLLAAALAGMAAGAQAELWLERRKGRLA